MGAWLMLAAPAWSAEEGGGPWHPGSFGMAVVATLVFGLVGIALAITGFKVFDLFTKFSLEEEICGKKNVAVAILCAGMVLGICIIVAATVY